MTVRGTTGIKALPTHADVSVADFGPRSVATDQRLPVSDHYVGEPFDLVDLFVEVRGRSLELEVDPRRPGLGVETYTPADDLRRADEWSPGVAVRSHVGLLTDGDRWLPLAASVLPDLEESVAIRGEFPRRRREQPAVPQPGESTERRRRSASADLDRGPGKLFTARKFFLRSLF